MPPPVYTMQYYVKSMSPIYCERSISTTCYSHQNIVTWIVSIRFSVFLLCDAHLEMQLVLYEAHRFLVGVKLCVEVVYRFEQNSFNGRVTHHLTLYENNRLDLSSLKRY